MAVVGRPIFFTLLVVCSRTWWIIHSSLFIPATSGEVLKVKCVCVLIGGWGVLTGLGHEVWFGVIRIDESRWNACRPSTKLLTFWLAQAFSSRRSTALNIYANVFITVNASQSWNLTLSLCLGNQQSVSTGQKLWVVKPNLRILRQSWELSHTVFGDYELLLSVVCQKRIWKQWRKKKISELWFSMLQGT